MSTPQHPDPPAKQEPQNADNKKKEEEPQSQKKQDPVPAKEEQKDEKGDKKGQQEEKKKKKNGYRLEKLKLIEINRRHAEQRGKARLLKEISFALFGRRRFRRIEVTCSLNSFFNALKICSIIHRGVAGMYMVVELEKVQYTQFQDQEDTKGTQKEHSLFRISLTKQPTQKDKDSYGFHQAFKAEDIKNPFKLPENMNKGKGRRGDRKGGRGYDRRNRKDNRDDKRGQKDYGNNRREDKNVRNNERNRRNNQDRYEREDRNDRRREYYRDQKQQRRRQRQRDDYHDRRRHRQRDQDYDRPRHRQRDEEYDRRRNRQNYKKDNRQTQYTSKDTNKKQNYEKKDNQQYDRGSYKSRGNGNISKHHYDQSHIRKENEEQRGDRKPRRNRYEISDEEW